MIGARACGHEGFQPDPLTLRHLAGFSNDHVYHVEVAVDVTADVWTLTIDGTQVFSNPYHASELQDVRFSMAPWYFGSADEPQAYAAIDNVVVRAVPESSTYGLLLASLPLIYWRRKRATGVIGMAQ